MAKARHSGLQKTVLKLYRECMQATKKLPAEARSEASAYVRSEFKSKASQVDKLDIQRIEFLMRQAKRKIETFTMTGVTSVAGLVPSRAQQEGMR